VDAELAREALIGSVQPFGSNRPAGCGAGILDAAGALKALDRIIDQTIPNDPGQIEDG